MSIRLSVLSFGCDIGTMQLTRAFGLGGVGCPLRLSKFGDHIKTLADAPVSETKPRKKFDSARDELGAMREYRILEDGRCKVSDKICEMH
jgi:hypothetical protein